MTQHLGGILKLFSLLLSHSFLLLCPCVDQHCLSSEPSLHPSFGYHILSPIICPVRVHHPQLLVALNYAVQTPQLVAKAFTLLSQDVGLFNRCAPDGTRTAAVGVGEPGQSGIGLSVLFAHAVQTQEDTWSEQTSLWYVKLFSLQLYQACFSQSIFSSLLLQGEHDA